MKLSLSEVKDFLSRSTAAKLHRKLLLGLEKYGRERYLLPEIHRLEPDSSHEPDFDRIVLLPPNDNSNYAKKMIVSYNKFHSDVVKRKWFPVYFILVFISIILLGYLLSLLNVLHLNSLNFVAYILFFSIFFYMSLAIPYALTGSIQKRTALWNSEYERLQNKEWMESIVDLYEQKFVVQPDARIEHLRALTLQKSQELEKLINEVSQSNEQAHEFRKALQEYDAVISQVVEKYYDMDKKKSDAIEQLLRPQAFVRDVTVNLVSNAFWVILVFVGGLIVGLLFGR